MFEVIGKFFTFVFSWNSQISLIINLFIISISALILVYIFFQVRNIINANKKFKNLKSHFLNLAKQEQTIKKIEELVASDEYKHPWIEKKFGTVQRLQNDTNAIIDAMDNIDANLRWQIYGILKYPISSLIIFGLLGTVAGLQRSVASFLPAVKTGSTLNLEVVRQVMLGTLQGMQTAFSTTLAGLVCSIFLGFLVSLFVKGYFDRYITSAKNFLVETIIPIYSVLDNSNINNIVNQTIELKYALKSIADLGSTLFQPIVESANRMSEGLNQIYESSQTYITISDSIQSFTNTLNASLATLSSSLKGVMVSIDKFNNLQTEIDTTVKSIAEIPHQFKEFISEINSEFKKHQDQLMDQYNNNTKDQLNTLIDASQSMTEQMNAWKEATSKTREAFKEAANKGVGELLAEVKDMLKEVAKTSAKIVEANNSLNDSVATIQRSQKDSADQYLHAYKSQYDAIHTELNEFLDKSNKIQDNRNRQVIDAISSWVTYNQFLSKLLKDMDRLPEKIASAIKDGNGKALKLKKPIQER